MIEAPPLVFDATEHRYFLGGTELPGVTSVLKSAGLVNGEWYTEAARLRGQYVHLACHMIDDDALDESSLDPALEPYVAAYREFLAFNQTSWALIEHRVFDAIYGYAGTLDRAGLINGVPFVLDIKSGGLPAFTGPQTAAYKRCLDKSHVWRRAALQLRADGTYQFQELTDRHDESVFLGALAVAKWKQRYL